MSLSQYLQTSLTSLLFVLSQLGGLFTADPGIGAAEVSKVVVDAHGVGNVISCCEAWKGEGRQFGSFDQFAAAVHEVIAPHLAAAGH